MSVKPLLTVRCNLCSVRLSNGTNFCMFFVSFFSAEIHGNSPLFCIIHRACQFVINNDLFLYLYAHNDDPNIRGCTYTELGILLLWLYNV